MPVDHGFWMGILRFQVCRSRGRSRKTHTASQGFLLMDATTSVGRIHEQVGVGHWWHWPFVHVVFVHVKWWEILDGYPRRIHVKPSKMIWGTEGDLKPSIPPIIGSENLDTFRWVLPGMALDSQIQRSGNLREEKSGRCRWFLNLWHASLWETSNLETDRLKLSSPTQNYLVTLLWSFMPVYFWTRVFLQLLMYYHFYSVVLTGRTAATQIFPLQLLHGHGIGAMQKTPIFSGVFFGRVTRLIYNLSYIFRNLDLTTEKKGFSSICTTSLKNISGCLWFCMSCRCWSCVVLVVAVVAGRSYETFRANIAAVPGGRTSSFEKAPIVLMSTARDSKPWSLAQQKNGTYVCHMSILYWCHFVIVWHTKCENIPLYCKTCGFFQHSCWSFMPATAISITPGTSSFTVLNLPAGRTCSTRQAAGVVSPA